MLILTGLVLMSCDSDLVYSDYKRIDNGWNREEPVTFNFKAPDTTRQYDLFINLRNDEKYRYSNLYLIVNLNFPDGKIVADTLEYEMARPDGEWLGKGFSSVKENKLWYKEAVVFPDTGEYGISIEQAMRKNGNVDGVTSLKGITDVGIAIERKGD